MRIIDCCVLIGMPVVLAATTARAQTSASDRFGVTSKRIEAPMVTGKMTLTDALTGGAKAMWSHFLIFGVELADSDYPAQPMVISNPPRGGTVGEFFTNTFRQAPNYEYEVVSEHTVSVYPRRAKDDPNNILNLRVPRFDVDGVPAGTIFAFPDMVIPELKAKLFPATPGKQQVFVYSAPVPLGPKVTLHLRDVTVRDILNAVAIATERPTRDGSGDAPYGWIYRTRTESGQKKPYFGVVWSLPPGWRDLVFAPRMKDQ